jgi:hypothetical protein
MKKHLALSFIWLCLTPFVALGQEFRATITGRVLDQNRAAVAGATVTVRNPKTNEAVSTLTNTDGVYNIPFLQPGSYNITVEAAGFKKYVRDNQDLQVGQSASIDMTLEVGAASETVTITGDAPLLEETKADRGNVIENRRITELPLNARNPFMLSTLTPGITYNGPAIYQRPFDNGAIADWSINGGLNRNNESCSTARRTTRSRAATTSLTCHQWTPSANSRSSPTATTRSMVERRAASLTCRSNRAATSTTAHSMSSTVATGSTRTFSSPTRATCQRAVSARPTARSKKPSTSSTSTAA